jgi:hypothetical protein
VKALPDEAIEVHIAQAANSPSELSRQRRDAHPIEHRRRKVPEDQTAKRAYLVAQEQNTPALLTGACNALACTAYYLGDFQTGLQYATRGAQIWRCGGVVSCVEEVDAPPYLAYSIRRWLNGT